LFIPWHPLFLLRTVELPWATDGLAGAPPARFAIRAEGSAPAGPVLDEPAGRPATGSRGSQASPLLPRARQRHVLLPGGITVKPESLWTSAAATGGRRRSVHRAPGDEVVRPAPLPCA